jgi:mannobiose 2-epimerase
MKNVFQKTVLAFLLIAALFCMLTGMPPKNSTMENHQEQTRALKDSLAREMRQALDAEFKAWYPLSVDTRYGGFLSDFDENWKPVGDQDKMIVTQARHVWATANASMFYKGDNSFARLGAHGMQFLKDYMWDKQYGGFFTLVSQQGRPYTMNDSSSKDAYGNAFAIYGLSAYFHATGDSTALKLAQEAFRWMDRHSYDSLKGGYFQFFSIAGKPYIDGYRHTPPKDYNSSIHILECFTELYNVWPDPLVRERLESLFHIIRDTMVAPKGYLRLYFDRSWKPILHLGSGPSYMEYMVNHVSYGHDVETGYLLLEASKALGYKNDNVTLFKAKKLVDHALEYGWDREHGGIFDGGYDDPLGKRESIIRNTKEWWSELEALNAFLLMADLFPNDEHHYFDKMCEQWTYCKKYLLDEKRGGWYLGGTDIVPENISSEKGSIWKGNYHTSRALINCINRLTGTGENNVGTNPKRSE